MSKTFSQIVISSDTFANWISLTNQMANAYANVVTTAGNTAGDTTSGNAFVSGTLGGNTVVVNYQLRGGTVDTAANLAVVSNVTFSGANTSLTSNVFVNSANLTVNANTFAITGVGGGNAVTISTNSTVTNTALISHVLTVQGNTTVVNSVSFSNTVTMTGTVSMANLHTFVTSGGSTIASAGGNTQNAATATDTIIDSFSGNAYRGGKYVISVKDNSNSAYQMTEILLMHDGVTGFTTEYATLRSVANNLAIFSANISGTTVRLWATPSVANSTYTISKSLLAV